MEKKLLFLASLFVTSLLVSNIVAGKLVALGNLIVPAAVFIFPITFLVTDTVSEVWGKKEARSMVWLGFFMSLVMIAFLQLARVLPPAPFWEDQPAFEAILGAVPRIVAASMAAYLVSQLHDVWAFQFWRRLTRGKHLWLRNNLSTATSQLLDSAIFISLAFAGLVEPHLLPGMIFSQFLVKLILAAVDTPFCYLAVNWVRKEGAAGEGQV